MVAGKALTQEPLPVPEPEWGPASGGQSTWAVPAVIQSVRRQAQASCKSCLQHGGLPDVQNMLETKFVN